MADVKAGVAYVDIRLGSIEQFKQKLKDEIEKATEEVTERVKDDLKEKMAPAGAEAGKVTAREMSKAFFRDAGQSFRGGLTALATGQFRTFAGLMAGAGAASALGFRSAFDRSLFAGFGNRIKQVGSTVKAIAADIGNHVALAFKAIPARAAQAGKAIDRFSQKVGFLSFQLTNFGFIASTAFTAPVGAILAFGSVIGVKTAVQIENATAALKHLTPAGTDVEALIKRLQALAQKSPIFNSADLVTFTTRMAASGLKIQEVEAFLKSFGNIALSVNADVSKIPFALEALVQMAGKGKVSMEELRLQLGDALPGTMEIVSNALGVTTGELYRMVEAGELTGKELIAALTKIGQSEKYLKGAAEGAETMGAKWQELKESVQNQLGQIFLDNSDQIKKALTDLQPVMKDLIKEAGPAFVDLIKGFAGLVKWVGKLVDWYKNLSPEQQSLINKIMLFAVVLGPVVLAAGLLGTAIAGITALFGAILTPVGAVILGIIALGIEIFAVVTYFKNLYKEGGRFKEVWDNIWNAAVELIKPVKEELKKLWDELKGAWEQLKKSFADIKDSFSTIMPVLKGLGIILLGLIAVVVAVIFSILKATISAVGPLVKAIASFIGGIIKILAGVITFLAGVFTGDWDKALKGLKLIWDGIWDAIVGTIVNIFRAIWNFVKGFVTGIVDFFKWLWDVLVGHSIIPDMVNAILEWFKKMVDKGVAFVKSLGKPFKDFYNSYIKPFISGISSGVDKALDYIKGLPGKIKSFFSDAGSWLISAGKNIVNGLIEGVRRMGGALKNSILDLIPGPVKFVVANALGINSPSKVFEEYGKFTVLGFIEGLKGNQASLALAAANTFSLMPPMITPNFGSPKDPIVDNGRAVMPALNIENYNEAGSDPDRIAEDLWFKINSRGGGF